MLHLVFGEIGAGKSAFLTYQIKQFYLNHGDENLAFSKNMIAQINSTRKKKLSYPKKPPIYANFDVTITKPNGKTFKPYYIKGKDIGLNGYTDDEEERKYPYIYPGAHIFLDEAQLDFTAKGEAKKAVLAFFQKLRHNYLEVWLACQRGLINKDIRALVQDFKLIKDLTHYTSIFGNITQSVWTVAEFIDRYDFEQYLATDGGQGESIEKCYVNQGDIFECYNSRSCQLEFMPPEGENF